jgi:hypothetical protein
VIAKLRSSSVASGSRPRTAARALERDESEERFDAALKKVAARKLKDREDGFPKGEAKPSKETR